ncbi:MAG: hypothetical protein DRI26_01105 [Chloroflexi bacterium]|nr:MAG: hypothetical protein DRI26_01105 [Chloroflexota bacterium]
MPNELVPRAPRIVTPRSFAPTDILSAIVQTQRNAYEDLVIRPLQALGIRAPEQPPTPEMLLQGVTLEIERMARQQGGSRAGMSLSETGASPKRGELPPETQRGRTRGAATRGSL